jgi:hypothetical protein
LKLLKVALDVLLLLEHVVHDAVFAEYMAFEARYWLLHDTKTQMALAEVSLAVLSNARLLHSILFVQHSFLSIGKDRVGGVVPAVSGH